MSDQRNTFHQLLLDYEAQLEQLRAEKDKLRQRQQERRWQGYGANLVGTLRQREKAPVGECKIVADLHL